MVLIREGEGDRGLLGPDKGGIKEMVEVFLVLIMEGEEGRGLLGPDKGAIKEVVEVFWS